MTTTMHPDWMPRGACSTRPEEADCFYPGPNASVATAQAICADCPVTSLCLAYALENQEAHGVWGGLSVTERERLLGKRLRPRTTSKDPASKINPCPECGRVFSGPGLTLHRLRMHEVAS